MKNVPFEMGLDEIADRNWFGYGCLVSVKNKIQKKLKMAHEHPAPCYWVFKTGHKSKKTKSDPGWEN